MVNRAAQWLVALDGALLFSFLIVRFAGQLVWVKGGSMKNTLLNAGGIDAFRNSNENVLPVIDRLAAEGNAKAFKFAKPHVDGYNYSFSGLKTSFLYTLRDALKENPNFIEENKADLAASLQRTIIEILMDKFGKAIKDTGIRTIAIGGGVSANSGMRAAVEDYARRHRLKAFIPKRVFTTDNAAMIAGTRL